jgi:predicted permease
MKKNNTLLYLLLLGGAAFAFISWKNKDKRKGSVIVEPLEKTTDSPDYTFTGQTAQQTPPIIEQVKDAIESTPEVLSTIITKAKGLFKKKAKQVNKKVVSTPPIITRTTGTGVQTIVKPKKAAVRKVVKTSKKAAKKRVKGFDDISILY